MCIELSAEGSTGH